MIRKPRLTAVVVALALSVMGMAQARDTAQEQNTTVASATDTGVLRGAPYRVDIPAHWNGELVMLLHGFEPIGTPRPTPKPLGDEAPVFLAAGYAVAQSSYATQGWAVDDALRDNERLRTRFTRKHGQPKRTWLVGFSMGGYVVLSSLEHLGQHYDGALSLCGANVPGTRVADDLLTSLVAFDDFFPHVAGLPPGGLANPTAPTLNQMQVMQAVDGALKTNEAAAQILARHAQVSRGSLAAALGVHYLVLHQMITRAKGLPVDNRRTDYAGFGNDVAFNRSVHRYTGDPQAMRYLATATSLSGNVHKPLVLQYNHDDPLITAHFQSVYPAMVQAAHGRAPTVLPPVGEGHCGFTSEQIGQAFKVLTDKVREPSRSKAVAQADLRRKSGL
ncbi:alpha/beta hydrolase family protein [Dyella sp.]|uniref:alpha/beta hydrolase family protein n=1 Tax=Dyella sp. TaxID=1869338 RepID=UPI003F811E26